MKIIGFHRIPNFLRRASEASRVHGRSTGVLGTGGVGHVCPAPRRCPAMGVIWGVNG